VGFGCCGSLWVFFDSFCRLAGLVLCILPVYLGAPYAFLIKSSYLLKKFFRMISWWNIPCYNGGDFNIVRFLSERSSDSRSSLAMLKFSEFIFEQGLMNISLVGGNFMWSNNRDPLSWFRTNRVLLSFDWEAQFPNASHRRLPIVLLDHFPLLLDCGDVKGR
jgi:hypothetical protein